MASGLAATVIRCSKWTHIEKSSFMLGVCLSVKDVSLSKMQRDSIGAYGQIAADSNTLSTVYLPI